MTNIAVLGKPIGIGRWQRLVQCSQRTRVQVVANQDNGLGLRNNRGPVTL
jgi:hypothetical protein